MDAAEALALLLRAGLGAGLAVALVALLRRPLRRWFGPSIAYGVWALLPAMTLAAAFSRVAPASEIPAAPMPSPLTALQAAVPAADPAATLSVPALLLALWLVGSFLMLASGARRQRRWRVALGRLHMEGDGIARAAPQASLPALVGWPRPLLVLPDDFEARFRPEEQALVLAHERRHLARGDLHALLAFELLRALLWFNPLLHWAARRFRDDQELACDAEVLAAHPQATADYARALLRTTAFPVPPLATAWGSVHPLKERLAMLQQSPCSRAGRRAGLGLVLFVVALCAGAAWAALPRAASGGPASAHAVPDGKLRQTWTLQVDGGATLGPFLLIDAPGVPVEIRFEHGGDRWTLRSAATALADGSFELRAEILRGDVVVGSPTLVISEKGGSIAIGQEVKVDSASGDLDVATGVLASVTVEAGDGTAMAGAVPRYPPGAAKAGAEGTVILRVDVSAEGRATDVRIERSSGHASLDDAAMARVREWTFTPGTKDGEPVAGQMLVPVEFRADGKPPAEG